MALSNASARELTVPAGMRFKARNGRVYASDAVVQVPAASRRVVGHHGHSVVTREVATVVHVWVDAVGRGGAQPARRRYTIETAMPGLTATGAAMTLDTQLFQGTNLAFEFDPVTERYYAVDPMTHKRWYPTLTGLSNGSVLAVSGLDGTGNISDGHTEIYHPATRAWSSGPVRYFPTYPALFLTASGNLFYTAANAGFGSPQRGRQVGMWRLATNRFTPIPGLPVANEVETAASLLLPPAQKQRFMFLGGGGVGSSDLATARTAIVDVDAAHPSYRRGPNPPAPDALPAGRRPA